MKLQNSSLVFIEHRRSSGFPVAMSKRKKLVSKSLLLTVACPSLLCFFLVVG